MRYLGILAVALTLLIVGTAALPMANAKEYHARDYLKLWFEVEKKPKPNMVPGGDFYLSLYAHNNINDSDKGFGVDVLEWRLFNEFDWHDATPYVGNGIVVIDPNKTVKIYTFHVHIPDSVRGNWSVLVQIRFYLRGTGWGDDNGLATDTVGLYYDFYVNPAGDSGGNNNKTSTSEVGGMPLWEMGAIAGVVIVILAATAVVVIRRKNV